MSTESDMTVPVTRGEMHQALETWGHALMDHAQKVAEKMAESLTTSLTTSLTAHVASMIEASERRLVAEIGRATAASAEQLRLQWRAEIAQFVKVVTDTNRTEIKILDDQYSSLPARVDRLEDTVFKPKPKRRAKG
jgi:hypothetical protein